MHTTPRTFKIITSNTVCRGRLLKTASPTALRRISATFAPPKTGTPTPNKRLEIFAQCPHRKKKTFSTKHTADRHGMTESTGPLGRVYRLEIITIIILIMLLMLSTLIIPSSIFLSIYLLTLFITCCLSHSDLETSDALVILTPRLCGFCSTEFL